MKIDCISDLHGKRPKLLGGDLLIIAGDITASDRIKEWKDFYEWLYAQDYKKKILIAGNHDRWLTSCITNGEYDKVLLDLLGPREEQGFEYLCDSGTEFMGFKIWGSPWIQKFSGINPKCAAFSKYTEVELSEKWALIPDDTDILITHTPAFGCLDLSKWCERFGSKSLADRKLKLNLKLHVFGHIHGSHGQEYDSLLTKHPWDQYPVPQGCLNINAALMNDDYNFVNSPIITVL